MKDFDKKARENLEETYYTFNLYSKEEQERLVTAWQIGYAESKAESLRRIKEAMLSEEGE